MPFTIKSIRSNFAFLIFDCNISKAIAILYISIGFSRKITIRHKEYGTGVESVAF